MSGGWPVETVGGSLDEALAHGAALLQSDPSLALKQAQVILRKDGREPRALRLAAAAHRARGEADLAAKAELLAIDEARRYPLLAQAAKALNDGDFPAASELSAKHLQDFPGDLAAIVLSAESALGIGLHDKAIPMLKMVLDRAPRFAHASVLLVNGLMLSDQLAEARRVMKPLIAAAPDDIGLLTLQNRLLNGAGDFEGCVKVTQDLIDLRPKSPDFRADHADALRFVGRSDDAKNAYRKALELDSDHARSWWSLADLAPETLTDADIAFMSERLAAGGFKGEQEVNFHFALALGHHARKNFDEAFAHFEAGNRIRQQVEPFDADEFAHLMQRHLDHAASIGSVSTSADEKTSPLPLFIVGMPRAGSTLLEQILASHSQVDGTLELPNILSLAHRLRGRKAGESLYPAVLHDLTPEQLSDFGEAFIEDTRVHRQGAPFFIDKMPNNFRHIGLIHLMLPNAKIIDARRAPMDCCFSGFKQLFAEGQEFTYGLKEIGQYYSDYVRLMDHWDEVLPGKVLRVQHEDVLDDLEGEVRRMLDYLELPFEEACLTFHETERAVRTASSEQVRRPINRSGQDAWKPFEPWLGELKSALGQLAD